MISQKTAIVIGGLSLHLFDDASGASSTLFDDGLFAPELYPSGENIGASRPLSLFDPNLTVFADGDDLSTMSRVKGGRGGALSSLSSSSSLDGKDAIDVFRPFNVATMRGFLLFEFNVPPDHQSAKQMIVRIGHRRSDASSSKVERHTWRTAVLDG
eukprot:CAMPEP_0168597278 /NCGR_PEP_ID=MMETSP0420-20121227/10560_1 /TAXON_ID=498008 /ORGANISM="Pessonella sp." /LENGTH=155 /DNA_ID=CAMNT_0008634081 /DNA_START=203 /DNA_END=667 /DNA_ORIENTATION=-